MARHAGRARVSGVAGASGTTGEASPPEAERSTPSRGPRRTRDRFPALQGPREGASSVVRAHPGAKGPSSSDGSEARTPLRTVQAPDAGGPQPQTRCTRTGLGKGHREATGGEPGHRHSGSRHRRRAKGRSAELGAGMDESRDGSGRTRPRVGSMGRSGRPALASQVPSACRQVTAAAPPPRGPAVRPPRRTSRLEPSAAGALRNVRRGAG